MSTTDDSRAEGDEIEPVDEFRARARDWLADNLDSADSAPTDSGDGQPHRRARPIQRRLWDGGFAGIRWPKEYGGLGLTAEHQAAFNDECRPYEMPSVLNVPTFGILAATLIDYGTHEQKLRHLPAILRGDEQWVQFLSEPTGGSDLAGCITRADRDGDVFILNGSKIWSSAAHVSDYAMCLARTNWDVQKHRGLTMLIIEIHQPGIQIDQIRQIDGSMEFCQEFFDDVVVPVTDVVGEIGDGWTVASRLLLHERMSLGGASPYTSGRGVSSDSRGPDHTLVELANLLGRGGDGATRQEVARWHVEQLVAGQLTERLTAAMANGSAPPTSGSILKLYQAVLGIKKAQTTLAIGGSDIVVGADAGGLARRLGDATLSRQALSLGGGSNEIQRNIISERVLGLPREWSPDRDVPYGEVQRNTMPTGPR